MKKQEKQKVNTSELKSLIIIVLVISIVFILIYLLTLGADKMGLFETSYVKPEVGEAVISYENISAGTILDRAEKEYYVAIGDFGVNKNITYRSELSIYSNKEDSLPVYIVDLSDEINSGIIGDKDNKNAKTVKDLSIANNTLLYVKDGKISKYIVGIDDITKELKK